LKVRAALTKTKFVF